MPRADEYAGAAAALRHDIIRREDMPGASIGITEHYTLAARCVRAMAALASGEVSLGQPRYYGGAMPLYTVRAKDGTLHDAADPLDAITAALGGDDAK
jgi:hypothetical protein